VCCGSGGWAYTCMLCTHRGRYGRGDCESCAVMCRYGACLVVSSGASPHIYMGRGHSKVMCMHVHVHACACACECACAYMHMCVLPVIHVHVHAVHAYACMLGDVHSESTRNSAGHPGAGFAGVAGSAFGPVPKIFSAACTAKQRCAVVHAHSHRARHTQHVRVTHNN
jgi:hypothetical protein